jgi:hypothetical protein
VTPLDAALTYAGHGWSVVPARVTGKGSLVAWKSLQQTAADPGQLRAWWRRWPRANVAAVTGRLSGVVVIDVDVRHGGDGALAELERDHGALPRTAVVATPSGGIHVYLVHPGGGRIPNSASRLGRGLDVRGDGGIALLPPSRRPDGAYRWALGGPGSVPPMPTAWAELLRPPPRLAAAGTRTAPGASQPPDGSRGGTAARLAGLLRTLQRAPAGQRNATLFWCGCRLAELMVDQGAPQAWVEILVRAGTATGLQEHEVRGTVASGLKAATRP